MWPLTVLALVGGAFCLGRTTGQSAAEAAQPAAQMAEWAKKLAAQEAQIADTKRVLQENIDALAKRVGQMNAHVIRLDALGQRLTEMANIDNREFDFEQPARAGRPRARHAGPGGADSATSPR